MPEELQAKLVRREDVTHDLSRFWFQVVNAETDEPAPFSFKAGQFCTLGVGKIERAYSIVSAPYERELEIFVELVDGGGLTPRIWKLKIDDYMSIRPRGKGLFLLDEERHHHFMLATVTGVAPYISMIRQYLYEKGKGHTFYVMLGASYMDELTYDTELTELAREHPEFIKFVPAVSRPEKERNSQWEGATGRLPVIVQEYLEKFNLSKDDTRIYLCGHPGMIEGAKECLLPNGWKIREERFWKE